MNDKKQKVDPQIEYTPLGAPILRHQLQEHDKANIPHNHETMDRITAHMTKYVGAPDNIFHEKVSDLVRVNVHVVNPTRERNFYTLVTSGMSDLPMNTPPEVKQHQYAELMICLPPDWKMYAKDGSFDHFKFERNYFPVRALKQVARLPHEYRTWVGMFHTVPNGDPAKPYAPSTRLSCMLVYMPVLFDHGFAHLKVNAQKVIHFYSLIPIYDEERQYKLKHGGNALLDRLADIDVTELLDVKRKNAVL